MLEKLDYKFKSLLQSQMKTSYAHESLIIAISEIPITEFNNPNSFIELLTQINNYLSRHKSNLPEWKRVTQEKKKKKVWNEIKLSSWSLRQENGNSASASFKNVDLCHHGRDKNLQVLSPEADGQLTQ